MAAETNSVVPVPTPKLFRQEGVASFYSHIGPTASGARSDPNTLTAAHKHLPLGSRARVTHLKSGKTVIVTINDRGPFLKGRIIDLSRQAAMQLGITGVARVRVVATD
jgi:rare lipoprotein A